MFKHVSVRALAVLALAIPAIAGLAVTTTDAPAATVLADSQWGPTPPKTPVTPVAPLDDSQWG
ncbi:hypothetical protein ACF09C_34875 [Streptomyces sp. NPDC014870]|uniref:hypothetical protein n=1 Tax=Streptomyces sp. NPDC014870 TaxID=3364925 RepID=UPI0036F6CCBE